ncbi:hypothetical protein [Candidatus Cardinium hertigii]|uniref:Uncharacterized protein n=1 Tax=Candidatus Cardinium hertigii TaxID=247481 RepID=A0A2Z3LCN8_9BACT|nr:hypothetical protein [Candidatus Cardinium hertigii]AWN81932.1 hypothetical protein DK880_00616 [Candidatus Cardinium hertigii]
MQLLHFYLTLLLTIFSLIACQVNKQDMLPNEQQKACSSKNQIGSEKIY